jgi:hypothetical protein
VPLIAAATLMAAYMISTHTTDNIVALTAAAVLSVIAAWVLYYGGYQDALDDADDELESSPE